MKKFYTLFVALVVMMSTTSAANFSGGTGWTEDDPFLISTAEQLRDLSREVYDGNPYAYVYFKLTANIDLSAYNWVPIGGDGYPFCGNFDGDNYRIIGLKININVPENAYAGLFGYINNGSVKNLGVDITSSPV
jgi:hypothetical protein